MEKTLIKYLEDLGYSISNYDGGYAVHIDNPCQEDFTIEIQKSVPEQEADELLQACEDFDVDEHFSLWYGADRGEPKSATELLKNCEAIESELIDLQYKLYDFKKMINK